RRWGDEVLTGALFIIPLLGLMESRAGDHVVAWGAGTFVASPPDDNNYGQSIVPSSLTNAALVAGGWRHSVALPTNRTLRGWGDDSLNQTDLCPPNASNYLAMACGQQHSIALRTDGSVAATGIGLFGETRVPANLTNAVAISAGFYHDLALR